MTKNNHSLSALSLALALAAAACAVETSDPEATRDNTEAAVALYDEALERIAAGEEPDRDPPARPDIADAFTAELDPVDRQNCEMVGTQYEDIACCDWGDCSTCTGQETGCVMWDCSDGDQGFACP
jgi:hypothetical protein